MQFVEASAWEYQQGRLREALRRDEFELYAQPIVAFDERSGWHMAEVLIRLRQEEKALLPPGEFLPAFELFGMMPQLDAWVLRRVVQHHLAGNPGRRYSVNVSGQTLEDPAYVHLFAQLIVASGVPAESVLFEVEEAEILVRGQAAERFADAMHALGGGIVIDGFGGRSVSFAPLKALQPDYVKIDGALTRRIAEDESCALKCTSIQRFAEAIGIGVIAECVETPEALSRLQAIGIALAQGYGICRPAPIEDGPLQELAAA
jgi:EAL domain-containing protein (putative c-di-GMP-specific phosphodiesterase class I)